MISIDVCTVIYPLADNCRTENYNAEPLPELPIHDHVVVLEVHVFYIFLVLQNRF